jgi:hypothetical protein
LTRAENEAVIALPCPMTGFSRAASGTLASVLPGGADRVLRSAEILEVAALHEEES